MPIQSLKNLLQNIHFSGRTNRNDMIFKIKIYFLDITKHCGCVVCSLSGGANDLIVTAVAITRAVGLHPYIILYLARHSGSLQALAPPLRACTLTHYLQPREAFRL